ncbi:MAG: DUF4367 domain-containing protein [Oscillospiraceae bacterium]|nr:DUF4367 domain-containing protein [Oscillospiraceae bacterium]
MKNIDIIKYITSAKMPNIEQVREKCLNQPKVEAKNMNRKKFIITTPVIILILIMLTAAAWSVGIILKSIIFDGFEANKVDTVIHNGKNVGAIWEYEITDPKVIIEPKIGNVTDVYFDTIKKAAEHLDFTPKTLGYLPEGYSFEYVRLLKYNNKYDKNSCEIWYRQHNKGELYNFDSFDVLSAKYVGENAIIKIATTSVDIEKIILNDGTEALLETIVTFSNGNSLYQLYWIKNGVGYMLGNNFEKDELIKMAESIR